MKRIRNKERPLNQKNSAKEPNKKKRRLTSDQSNIMKVFYFDISQYPTPEQYTNLANQLKIDKAKVKNWFHNRRARDRKSGTGGQLKLDYFKSNTFWNQTIIFPYPPPKYLYSGELLFRMLALRATEAIKRDIEMKTGPQNLPILTSAPQVAEGLKESLPLQNSKDCPINSSIPDFKTLCCDLYLSDSYYSNPYYSNPYSSDLQVEYINCLYPLLLGN